MQYYFRIFFRSLLRHRVSSLINIIGLTTGLSCALIIYLWVNDEFSINKFHEKDDRLYRVMEFQTYSNETFATNSTPGILAENLKKDFPDIKYAAVTTWINPALLAHEQTYFRENGYHVGPDFFNIFSYPLLAGDPDQVMQDKSSICISRTVAEKFFGSVENAMGKQLRYEDARNFIVSGVFETIHPKSTYKFDFTLPFEDYADQNDWVKQWGNNGPHTFVILENGADPDQVTAKITNYIKGKDDDSNVDLFLKKYSDQYLYGNYTNGQPDGGRIDYVRLFSIIAIFILVIACINFMNLSTARATKRAHEIGVKKALGANRSNLISQFISEAILISTFSMLFSFLIVWLFLPQFNEITEKTISMEFSPELIVASILTVIITGVLAGSYPALYLTHFNPVTVLKGHIKKSAGEVWARKGLVVFQFTITIILIVGVIVIYKQTEFAFNKNLGYSRENVVMFSQDGGIYEKRDAFFNELRRIPGVVNACGLSHTFTSQMSNTSGLDWRGKTEGERILFENIRVDYHVQETMGMEMVTGRWFSREFGADSSKIVLNEAAARVMGFTPEEAIGENIKLWDEYDLEIVGIVKDFHYQSIHTTVDPAFFWLRDTWNVAVKLEQGKEVATMAQIQNLYERFSPGFIFEYDFLDKNYEKLYRSELRIGTLSSYFAGFAILISCLGLFGLAAFTAERRTKEIGIRKALGATTSQIVMMLSGDFTKLVLISVILALPISYYFMKDWLDGFAYKIDLSIWIFVGAALAALVIAWLTVSSQAIRAANVNPAKCLKDE